MYTGLYAIFSAGHSTTLVLKLVLSVCHTREPRLNGSRYCNTFAPYDRRHFYTASGQSGPPKSFAIIQQKFVRFVRNFTNVNFEIY